ARNGILLLVVFFFFQAEDGIRDFHVTGVQTCALPILYKLLTIVIHICTFLVHIMYGSVRSLLDILRGFCNIHRLWIGCGYFLFRSEERRVGKECRSGWSSDQ